MANTQSMCTSFMSEMMLGQHQFTSTTITSRGSLTSPTADTFKAALYLASATVNASTTAYSATNEASGAGYTAGGISVGTWNTPTGTNATATAGVAFTTPTASLTYSSVTLSTAFDAVLIYNNTQSNKAVSVHTFGSQTVTAGTFTLTMPSNTTTAALLRLSTT